MRIHSTMKKGGILHLMVSTMIKPSSGHFSYSIDIWKKYGKGLMDLHFINEGKTIWRKK